MAVMLDHERDVRQLADGRNNPASVARASELVSNIFAAISLGVARFDAFGRLVLVPRVGFDPTEETSEALERRYEEIAPMIENIVRRTLPWLRSREIMQGQLPL